MQQEHAIIGNFVDYVKRNIHQVIHGYKMKRKKTSDNDTDKTVEQPDAIDSNCASIKNATTVVREVISMCVAPVRLRHCNFQKEVKTFALLDSCSQGTFVTE